jgi:hypothetical protein
MKILSPSAHGVMDYATVAIFALAPTIFGFTGTYATVCYVLAAGYLVITLLTAFPMGAIKMIPFPIHGGFELVSGPIILASPWIFGFADANPVARNFFVGMGIIFLLVWMITDWHAQTQTNARGSLMTDHNR